jgi:hypothetical protein
MAIGPEVSDALDAMPARDVERLIEKAQRRLARCFACGTDGAFPATITSKKGERNSSRASIRICAGCRDRAFEHVHDIVEHDALQALGRSVHICDPPTGQHGQDGGTQTPDAVDPEADRLRAADATAALVGCHPLTRRRGGSPRPGAAGGWSIKVSDARMGRSHG